MLSLAACSSDGSNDGASFEAIQKQLERPPEILVQPGQYQGDTGMAVGKEEAPASHSAQKIANPAIHFEQLNDKMTAIGIDEPYARSWSMVAAALRGKQFMLKDKDREKGVFYLIYDPGNNGDGTFWQGLSNLFSSDDEAGGEYRVKLQEQGAYTEVTAEMVVDDVWDDDYYIDVKANAKTMLKALYEILRTLPAEHSDR